MDKTSIVVGFLIGFIVGAGALLYVEKEFAIQVVESLPPGVIGDISLNMSMDINQTKLINDLNSTGLLDKAEKINKIIR